MVCVCGGRDCQHMGRHWGDSTNTRRSAFGCLSRTPKPYCKPRSSRRLGCPPRSPLPLPPSSFEFRHTKQGGPRTNKRADFVGPILEFLDKEHHRSGVLLLERHECVDHLLPQRSVVNAPPPDTLVGIPSTIRPPLVVAVFFPPGQVEAAPGGLRVPVRPLEQLSGCARTWRMLIISARAGRCTRNTESPRRTVGENCSVPEPPAQALGVSRAEARGCELGRVGMMCVRKDGIETCI